MNAFAELNLALILFLPWFLLLGALFWLFPRQPRNPRRKAFDIAALVVAFVLSFVGMQWGYALGGMAEGEGRFPGNTPSGAHSYGGTGHYPGGHGCGGIAAGAQHPLRQAVQ